MGCTRWARRATGAVLAAALVLTGCGDDASDDGAEPVVTTTVPPFSTAPVTTAPVTTAPSTTGATTTAPPTGPVAAPELVRAEDVVVRFLAALGRGDIDAAAALLGPASTQRATAAGGVATMLRPSVEGHGAWAAAGDRSVRTIGMAPDLAAVVFEGTLRIEGMVERRVAAYPVRKATSGEGWLVELWAYDLRTGGPLGIVSPAVDDEEQAVVPSGRPLDVVLSAPPRGEVLVSLDGGVPSARPVDASGRAALTVGPPLPGLVTVLYVDGSTLGARAFRVIAG